jgi:seryl-tRNA synthetase
MARLQRALAQFMLDHQTGVNGHVECAPPLMVKDEAVFGTGQLPKFAEDLFRTTDGRWLIPTAEVSLTNAVREQILPATALPMRLTALTPCFRSKRARPAATRAATSASTSSTRSSWSRSARPRIGGRARADDAGGRIGASGARPALSQDAAVRGRHGLYRADHLRPRSLAARTGRLSRDLVVLELRRFPGTADERALSPRRRERHRVRPHAQRLGPAVGRTLVAVLENYQQEDGSVEIPAVLAPYMGGITRLVPQS